jgi:hypothetical protein
MAIQPLDTIPWISTTILDKSIPEITLGMNTNGAVQSTFFWHALGRLFNKPKDFCVFSIDGLEDTNPVYRKNVDWKKLMSNPSIYCCWWISTLGHVGL